LRSSYIKNDFGQLLRNYIVNLRPVNIVELGVLDGYSTLHIAQGNKDQNDLYNIVSYFHAYDLFEDYAYKHGSMEEVKKLMVDNGVDQYVDIRKGNAYEVHELYPDSGLDKQGIEFLHVDISNTGKVVHDIVELWDPKLAPRCILCIEGGSDERDQIEWMVKGNHPSIKAEISTNPILNKWYMYGVYYKFPSMFCGMKKWWNVDKQ
jgi:hypothetical protein